MVSLYATHKSRKKRFLKTDNNWIATLGHDTALKVFNAADIRDSGAEIQHSGDSLFMQNVPKCVDISDIAINNESENKEDLYEKFIRYLCLILSPGCTKPTTDEVFMNMAYTMAMKSNCVCRQVGAVVVGEPGFVIGAGWNDVGSHKISCGLRVVEDLRHCHKEFTPLMKALGFDDANQCCKYLSECLQKPLGNSVTSTEQFSFCFKDIMAQKNAIPKIQRALESIIKDAPSEQKPLSEQEITNLVTPLTKELVARGNLHQLEFCLALHAEENAILQSSRIGGVGLEDSTLYSTAQPCTLCAKKAHQVGIKKVVFTEPYPKAHSDLYMPDVEISQFEGVKPRSYIRLFMPHHDQKEWQILQALNMVPTA